VDLLSRMDPEIAAVYPNLPRIDLTDIAGTRARLSALAAGVGREPSRRVVREDLLVPGSGANPPVRLRCYRPAGQTSELPVLYWMHGGGYVLGSLDQDDVMMEQIVEDVGCVCISVDWRRSPENPFPAAMDDCRAGLSWVYEHAEEIRINRERIAIGGGSAGGGLAAGLALVVRDEGEIPLMLQLLVYPMIDDRNVTPSSHAIVDPSVWCRTTNVLAWRAYIGASTGPVSPYAAPARAADLRGLPAAYVVVGELDLFVDEDIAYAQRLINAAVPTELHVYPGAIHGFNLFAPHAEVSRRFVRDRNDALRRCLEVTR
jgi:acetyl esterase/lipase